jgi:hypothetical protein
MKPISSEAAINGTKEYMLQCDKGTKVPTLSGLALFLEFNCWEDIVAWCEAPASRKRFLTYARTCIEEELVQRMMDSNNRSWKAQWSYLSHHYDYRERRTMERDKLGKTGEATKIIVLPEKSPVGAPICIPHKEISSLKHERTVEKPKKPNKNKGKARPDKVKELKEAKITLTREDRAHNRKIREEKRKENLRPYFKSKWSESKPDLINPLQNIIQ